MSGQDFPTLKAPGSAPFVTSIFDCTDEFLQQLRLWLEMHPLSTPISSVLGFNQFTALHAATNNKDSITVANTWQVLAHPGPSLTAIPPGSYVIMYGCNYDASGGATGVMGGVPNGASLPTFSVQQDPVNVERFLLMRTDIVDLPNDSNDLTFKYWSTQVGPSFSNRWVVALKYASI